MSKTTFVMANIGSSSKKYTIYQTENSKIQFKQKIVIDKQLQNTAKNVLKDLPLDKAKTIFGLRVVAPGIFFQDHRTINQKFISELKKRKKFAPLHITPVLEEIKLIKKHYPKSKLIACSDSNFHKNIPVYARSYAIPVDISKKNEIYRYGYHGLANQSAISQLKKEKLLRSKTVICHLGSGCSITAVKRGKSVDNSMGFSPLEGIMGSTRSGTIDPTIKIPNKILNQESGFKGLTGTSDLRAILKNLKEPKNKDALDIFIHQIKKRIGSAIATLNGIDLLVFTGGIGENSKKIRDLILKNLTFTKFKVEVIKVDEELEMLKTCQKLIIKK